MRQELNFAIYLYCRVHSKKSLLNFGRRNLEFVTRFQGLPGCFRWAFKGVPRGNIGVFGGFGLFQVRYMGSEGL